jgi:hypothetical protein
LLWTKLQPLAALPLVLLLARSTLPQLPVLLLLLLSMLLLLPLLPP